MAHCLLFDAVLCLLAYTELVEYSRQLSDSGDHTVNLMRDYAVCLVEGQVNKICIPGMMCQRELIILGSSSKYNSLHRQQSHSELRAV